MERFAFFDFNAAVRTAFVRGEERCACCAFGLLPLATRRFADVFFVAETADRLAVDDFCNFAATRGAVAEGFRLAVRFTENVG